MSETIEKQVNGKATSKRVAVDLSEIGSTGLKRFGGIIFEEFLRELQSPDQRYRIEREMAENDASIASMLFVIEMLSRQTKVIIIPGGDTPQDEKAVEHLRTSMNDMTHTWDDFRSDVIRGTLVHGFNLNEEVYKRRLGENKKDRTVSSKFNDGLIGWKKLPIRAQDTIWDGWIFDEHGDLQAVKQTNLFQSGVQTSSVVIPYEKLLHFRTTGHKGNPEGRSALRGAFRAWVFKKRFENILAIGLERDLAGIPIMWVPPHMLEKDAPPDDKAALEMAKKIVQRTKRDEQEGMVLPNGYDENNNPLWRFELLTTGGRRQFDIVKILQMFENQILRTALSGFIKLGEDKVGSFALADNKTAIFATAIDAWLKSFDQVINQFAIPRLFNLNPSIKVDKLPSIAHGDIESLDLTVIADFISKLDNSGAGIWPNDKLKNFLLEEAKLPVSHDDTP